MGDDGSDKASFDPNRRLCPDGACVGLLSKDGRCQICGRADPVGPSVAPANALNPWVGSMVPLHSWIRAVKGGESSAEERRIHTLVKERVELAKGLGIPGLLAKLAPEVASWETWLHDKAEEAHQIIRSIQKVGEKTRVDLIGEILDFVFASHFTELPDGNTYHFAQADIIWQDKRVFGLFMSETASEGHVAGAWRPFEVNAFVDGPWVQVFLRFAQRLEALRNALECARHEQVIDGELQQAKKNFGLE
jgi:hypothetical protein